MSYGSISRVLKKSLEYDEDELPKRKNNSEIVQPLGNITNQIFTEPN